MAVLEKGKLEEISLWYKYKTLVWEASEEQEPVIHNIMRVLRSIRFRGLAYVSVPITSGKFFYDLQLQEPTLEKAELIKKVIDHNYQQGWELVEQLLSCRHCPVLYPADLFPAHQKWGQEHFQALWLNLIAELCTELHMCEGWEYSNGGVEEFTHVMQLRLGLPKHPNLIFFNTKGEADVERARMKSIRVCDHFGNPIELEEGRQKVLTAISWLEGHGFNTERLTRCVELLDQTDALLKEGFYQ